VETLYLDLFFFTYENLAAGFNIKLCKAHSAALQIVGESVHISESQEAIGSSANLKCKKFPWKGGVKKICAIISGIDIPKEIGVFKDVLLVIFPSHLQFNNLLKFKFVYLLVVRLMGKLFSINCALGLEIGTKALQNCSVKFL